MADSFNPPQGNADLYGLGIRVGIYAQLVTSLLANYLLPKELSSTWDANFIFLAALLIATTKSAISSDLTAIEAFILLHLMFAFLLSVFTTHGSYAMRGIQVVAAMIDGLTTPESAYCHSEIVDLLRAHDDYSRGGVYLRRLLTLAIASFNVWFWFSGIYVLRHGEMHQQENVFLFAYVDMHGPARMAFRCFSVVYLSLRSFRVFSGLVVLIAKTLQRWKGVPHAPEDEKEPVLLRMKILRFISPQSVLQTKFEDKNEPSPFWTVTKNMLHRSSKFSRRVHLCGSMISHAICCSVIVYFILAVELTLARNKITGINNVDSTGQFIPLFVGLAGLLRILLLTLVDYMVEHNELPRKINIDRETAHWNYRLSSHATATFTAARPDRRWSSDMSPVGVKQTSKNSHLLNIMQVDRLAPVLPVFPGSEKRRLEQDLGQKPVKVLRRTGRFMYKTPGGCEYAFHHLVLKRRFSMDERHFRYDEDVPYPHRVRNGLHVPLRNKATVEAQEATHMRWYNIEQAHRRKKYRTVSGSVVCDDTSTNSTVMNQDIRVELSRDQGSWMRTPIHKPKPGISDVEADSASSLSNGPRSIVYVGRRRSFDDAEFAEQELDQQVGDWRRLLFEEDESSVWFSSDDSMVYVHKNDHGQTSSNSSARKPSSAEKIKKFLTTLCSVFLCFGPLVAVIFHISRAWSEVRLKLFTLSPATKSEPPPRKPHSDAWKYDCGDCDEEIRRYRSHRWRGRRASFESSRSQVLDSSDNHQPTLHFTSLLRWSVSSDFRSWMISKLFRVADISTRKLRRTKFCQDIKHHMKFAWADQHEEWARERRARNRSDDQSDVASSFSYTTYDSV